MSQNNRVKFTSNKGRAQYPWLNQPDTAFGGEPKYKTNLIVDDASALVDTINQIAESEFGKNWKSARLPYKTDEDTGETVFVTKSKYVPVFFDATGANLVGEQVPKIWGGSVLRVGGFATPYSVSGSNGVSLQLTRVQIIEPVSSGEQSGDGFDAVEGGFVGQEILQEAFDAEDATETQSADRF
jgi:hypothetical protein|tara:strand:+ start:1204 stop:1755 length:552 start_codon:yes stop_codon:yes gene_type:complete